ncbi:hypothetical protein GF336_02420 [Candidatus Woesearchaeota archaeon]|nr:hypothetical protein [Candidatus Woesearchaeota archaeon]
MEHFYQGVKADYNTGKPVIKKDDDVKVEESLYDAQEKIYCLLEDLIIKKDLKLIIEEGLGPDELRFKEEWMKKQSNLKKKGIKNYC